MAQKTISQLQLRDDVEDGLNIPSDDGIQSFRVTAAQIWTYLQTKLGTGSAQQILKTVAGLPVWSWQYANQRTATTTDAINATTDHVVLFNASGAAFTATLPTASSVAGKVYVLKKIGTDINLVTIATTSAQTIDGASTTTLATPNESIKVISDGSNWLILERNIPSEWVAYTPTIVGFGTPSGVTFYSKRDKGDLLIQWAFTVGTSTANIATATLGFNGVNGGLTSKGTSQIRSLGQIGGLGFFSVVGAVAITCLAIDSDTKFYFGIQYSGGAGFASVNGNAIASSGQTISGYVRVPILGWAS